MASIDERVEGGRDYGVEEGDKLALFLRVTGWRLQVHVDGREVEKGNDQQVGRASPDGLVPPPGGPDPQHCPSNEAIGEKDEGQRDQHEEGYQHGQSDVIHCKRQLHCQDDLNKGVAKTAEPGRRHQLLAEWAVHDNGIPERLTDGHVAVQGHGGQDNALGAAQPVENGVLHGAATITDGLPGTAHVDQHLRDGGGGVAEVQKGQVTKENVHRAVKLGIQLGDQDNGDVSQHSQNVRPQQHYKEWELQPWPVRNAQEDEVLWGVPEVALVVTSHAEASSGSCGSQASLNEPMEGMNQFPHSMSALSQADAICLPPYSAETPGKWESGQQYVHLTPLLL
ncbi:hypothetical protein U0070_000252 [Myodes glareolus]|uniref:Uncharacterized protein n=1 Tax=Myodes glareolus TaxID=447135 RepID=A0AAW0HAW3_MYOGA